MADGSKIEWTDATWNPITGCSVLSPGCTNCYAMRLAGTRMQHHPSRAGLTKPSKAGPVWNGQVRLNQQWLDQPLHWKRPRMIFVCAHADLFHHGVPFAWIDHIFAVMGLAGHHIFQVLSKRSPIMRAYFADPTWIDRVIRQMEVVKPSSLWNGSELQAAHELRTKGYLPNIWVGVSVEDQTRADERIPDLLATPAAVRWLSCEPLLGSIDLTFIKGENALNPECWGDCRCDSLYGYDPGCRRHGGDGQLTRKIDWVVVGGESGPGARPMHISWARELREQCEVADVAFHFKQWGDWFPYGEIDADGHQNTRTRGEEPGLWHEWGGGEGFSVRIGKQQAGRFLDGITHDGMPA